MSKPSIGVLAAKKLMERRKIISDRYTGELYVFDNGVYLTGRKSECLLMTELQNLLGDSATINNKKNAYSYIKDAARPTFKRSTGWVCVQNGYLNLGTRRLIQHHDGVMLTHKLPVTYNEEIGTEEWERYVLELVNEQDKVDTLAEMVGYSFQPTQIAKKLFYIWGTRDSGKSTFFEVLRSFWGAENCSELSLYQIVSDKFMLHNLRGKIANIRSDIDYSLGAKTMSILKSLTGDDSISMDVKFVAHATVMTNQAKIILSGNGVPKIPKDENDDAFFSRWIPIEFPNEFEHDPVFKKKYLNEKTMSAILNWALDGYDRLRTRKWGFTYDPGASGVKDWFSSGFVYNDVDIFLGESWVIPGKDNTVKHQDLYNAYKSWCDMAGYTPVDIRVFGRYVLNNRMFLVTNYRPGGDDRERCYRGIKLGPIGLNSLNLQRRSDGSD